MQSFISTKIYLTFDNESYEPKTASLVSKSIYDAIDITLVFAPIRINLKILN